VSPCHYGKVTGTRILKKNVRRVEGGWNLLRIGYSGRVGISGVESSGSTTRA
jgi:hypothetical protein